MTENIAIENLKIIQNSLNDYFRMEHIAKITIDVAIKSLERQKAVCKLEYLGENTMIGCRNGRCSCGNIIRSYQNFCDNCGVKLDWDNVTKNG